MKNFTKILAVSCAMIFAANAANADDKPEYIIEIKDHKFTPDVVMVEADKEFVLVVKNSDATAEEFESHDLKKEKVIKGGKEAKINIQKLKAGEYKFVGEFHESTAKGKIIVK